MLALAALLHGAASRIMQREPWHETSGVTHARTHTRERPCLIICLYAP